MRKAFTVSEARSRLGALLDKVSKGGKIFLRRKDRLYRVEEVSAAIPVRPVGYFRFDNEDELTVLANRAETSFTAVDAT